VSCPSTTLCVATDWDGNVITSTDPTGGAKAWSIANVDSAPHLHALVGVSCPSPSLCIAPASDSSGGNLAVSTSPAGGAGAWTLDHIDGDLELVGAGCASNSLCVAFDTAGDVLSSTDPTGGPAAWTVAPPSSSLIPSGGLSFVSVSCPSVSLCIAAGGRGVIVSSTNPAGGSSAWTAAPVDVPECAVTTPCIAEELFAADDSGAHVLDSSPAGTGQVISDPSLSGNVVTWTDAGAARQVTLR
jgi:hypothetical protein